MISSEDLKLAFLVAIKDSGQTLSGLSDPIYQLHINMGINNMCMDALAGKVEMNPAKLSLIRQSLGGAHRMYTGNDILYGTPANGALLLHDNDNVTPAAFDAPPTGRYAFLVPIPPEVLIITSRMLITIRGGKFYPSVDVESITLEKYHQHIHHAVLGPQDGYAWAYRQNADTPAGITPTNVIPANALLGTPEITVNTDWDKGLINSTEAILPGLQGKTIGIDKVLNYEAGAASREVTIPVGWTIEQLIPKKDWKPFQYTIHYYRRPNYVIISAAPELRVHSELDPILLPDIVEYARRNYIASLSAAPEGYQISDAEVKN